MKYYTMTVLLTVSFALFLFQAGCRKADQPPEAPKRTGSYQAAEKAAEKLFNERCLMCHHDSATMKKISKPDEIIKTIRKPRGGMPKFAEEEISDAEAEALAKYIFFRILTGALNKK